MPKPRSVHRVSRYLEQQLRLVEPGGALPSTRQVMAECQVGPQTVAQAVREMERRKLVRVKPQHGVFKTDEADGQRALSALDVLYFNIRQGKTDAQRTADAGPFHLELLRQIRAAARQRSLTLRIHPVPHGSHGVGVIGRIARDPACSACLTVSLQDPSLLERLDDEQLPHVNLFPAGFFIPPHSIVTSPDQVVTAQIEHLTGLGHRRIAYLHNAEPDKPHRDILLRREAFYRLALEHDLQLRPAYVQFAGYQDRTRYRATASVLSARPRPTAVICADHHLPQAYAAARDLGFTPGREVSILGTDDFPFVQDLDPPASSLRISRQGSVAAALALLEQVLHNGSAAPNQAICSPVRVIARQSTASALTDN